jgi:ribose-phosphate pyrophosphokinase
MDAAAKMSAYDPAAVATDSSGERTDTAASAVGTAVAADSSKSAQKTERKPVRERKDEKFKIFSGTANLTLSKDICDFLGLPLGQTFHTQFSDGEIYVQILENVRGADVFIVQPTCDPVAHNLLQLLLMIDALKRASARRITTVIPYFGYARQDRKDKPRVPISSKLVADLLTTAGADRALVVDLHAPQIQGFFNIPVDHLFASPVLVDHFRKLNLPDLTVVSPMPAAWNGRAFSPRRSTPPWPSSTSGART